MTGASNNYHNLKVAVLGMGVSGIASAKFLLEKGATLSVYNDKVDSVSVAAFCRESNRTNISVYQLNDSVDLNDYELLVVSPGISLQTPCIQRYLQSHDQNAVIGDIELFAREFAAQTDSKLIAVTGSNGKSSVVDMLTKALVACGVNAGVGGNFGTSALDMLKQEHQVYVLELSSFQLETTYTLAPDVACILNISSDHLDRHGSFENYVNAKQRIYHGAKHLVYNQNDSNTAFDGTTACISSFADSKSDDAAFYVHEGEIYSQSSKVLNRAELNAVSAIQLQNFAAVLSILQQFSLDTDKVCQSLLNYQGLPHRFERVFNNEYTTWINDSKATNPGASIAAITSAARDNTALILIAGGDAKGADTKELAQTIKQKVSYLILLGKDAALFTQFDVPYSIVSSLEEAVRCASEQAKLLLGGQVEHVTVLLAPACASIDMFKNYQQRGDLFNKAVLEQVAA